MDEHKDEITSQSNAPSSEQTVAEPLDDVQNLYIGPIRGAEPRAGVSGQIEVDGWTTESRFWGELLLYGQFHDGNFVVERLRRVALYGELKDPPEHDPVGVFSLVGPLDDVELRPGSDGQIAELRLELHYDDLTENYEPLYEVEDAVFPQVEVIKAMLTLAPAGEATKSLVPLRVTLRAEGLEEPVSGRVRALEPQLDVLTFSLAGSGTPSSQSHRSIMDQCTPPPSSTCDTGCKTVERRLPIRFVNFSKLFTMDLGNLTDVENICNAQLDEVCQVWRNKGALDLRVESVLVEGSTTDKDDHATVPMAGEWEVSQNTLKSVGHVEVYLVDELLDRDGGGITHNCGKASAYCILDLTKLRQPNPNPRLLAHELGHVLGLNHPNCSGYPGSAGSVMEPATPNSAINTEQNFGIFTAKKRDGQTPRLNSIVATTNIRDCFHPDP